MVEAAVPDGYTTISDVEGDSTEITNTHTPPTTPDQPHTGADVQQAAWIAVAIFEHAGAADRCQDGFAEAGVA